MSATDDAEPPSSPLATPTAPVATPVAQTKPVQPGQSQLRGFFKPVAKEEARALSEQVLKAYKEAGPIVKREVPP